MKGRKFLRHLGHENGNFAADKILEKEEEVMKNKIKNQRKTGVDQEKKLWKMMTNYRGCILYHPVSQGNVCTQRAKDV